MITIQTPKIPIGGFTTKGIIITIIVIVVVVGLIYYFNEAD
jgi:hypothetical protein